MLQLFLSRSTRGPASQLRTLVAFGAVLLGFGSVHCVADDASGPDLGDGGADGDPRNQSALGLGDDQAGPGDDELLLNPFCGMGKCVPDHATACVDPSDDGMGGYGGSNLGGAAGGVNFNPGDLGVSRMACQVGPKLDCEGVNCAVERTCVEGGASVEGDPCVTAADCSPGLACVGEGLSGVCRPYCCQGTVASCGVDKFCDERRLLETPEIYVPVCLPLDNCPLTDPFPCSEDRDCTCQGNRACMIVRADGATACTIPGAGQAGDPCSDQATADCAFGFVCGPSQICLQICSTVNEDSGCVDGGTCLKQSALGGDLGICIASADGSEATR